MKKLALIIIINLCILGCSSDSPSDSPSNQGTTKLITSFYNETTPNQSLIFNYDDVERLSSIVLGPSTLTYEYTNNNLTKYSYASNNQMIYYYDIVNNGNNVSEIIRKTSMDEIVHKFEYMHVNNVLTEVKGYEYIDGSYNHRSTSFLEYQNGKLHKRTIIDDILLNEIYIIYEYDDYNSPYLNMPAYYLSLQIENFDDTGNTNNVITETTYNLETDQVISENNIVYQYDNDDFPLTRTITYFDGDVYSQIYTYNF